ncbi:MAG: phytoene desaturase family protein [Acidobacteriota bacterium]
MTTAQRDVIVIGGGVNGLTCAAYLAKAGLGTLVLERLSEAGGGARTEELAPGFRIPTLAHAAGPLRRDVIEHLQLRRHGLEFCAGDVHVLALGLGSPPIVLYADGARTAAGLRSHSPRDADAWPRFAASMAAIGRVIGTLFTTTAPPVDHARGRDLWSLLRTLRAFRALDKSDAYRLLRWGPMAVADLVSESFETERLRAAVAADGILGSSFGPWSAGSGLGLLLRAANSVVAPPQSWFARGGPGAIAAALERALRAAGGEVRVNASVAKILVKDEQARGVVLADGTELTARAVISGIDPKHTFLTLCDPLDLAPEFLWRMRHYRAHGTLAKINLALSSLPDLRGLGPDALRGRVRVCPDLDYLERAFDHAKYGRYSPEPYIEFTVPTLDDPGLAPVGAHVLSAYVQFAPYTLRHQSWDDARDGLADAALEVLERYTPGLRSRIVASQVITPLDLERTYGLSGGHIFHGELALDQLLTMRPLLGWGQYRTPIRSLYLCGSGTHPGTGLTGGSGVNAAREYLRDLK